MIRVRKATQIAHATRLEEVQQQLGMTLERALEIRKRSLQKEPVTPAELQSALMIIEESVRFKRAGKPVGHGGRPYKFTLPKLSAYERERVNAILLFHLGQALLRRAA